MHTFGELKRFLDIKTNEAEPDVMRLQSAVISFIERFTGRWFGPPKVFTEELTGWGPDERDLWLSEAPLADPAPVVTVNGAVLGAGAVRFRGARMTRKDGWPADPDGVAVTYTAGYAAGEEPPEIRQAVIDLVALRWRRRGMEGMGGESLGAEYTANIPASHVFQDADLRLVPGLEPTLSLWRRRRA